MTPEGTRPGRYPATSPGGFYVPLDPTVERALLYNPAPDFTTASITSDWSLDENLEISGRSRFTIDGWQSRTHEEKSYQKMAAAALGSAGQGMKVKDYELSSLASGETIAELKIASKEALAEKGGLYTFELPQPPLGMAALHLPVGDIRRTTPVALPYKLKEDWRFVLHLKGGLRAVDVPSKVEFENSVGQISSTITADEHDIEVRRTIEFKVVLVKPEDYGDLQSLLTAWQQPAHNTLILSK